MTKMEGQYSDEPLDGLLRVLVELGGDRMSLQTDTDPVAFHGERKLRLTLPSTSTGMLQTLCGRMAATHTATGMTHPSSFTYYCKNVGTFVVDIEGSFAPHEVARLHIRRTPADATTLNVSAPLGKHAPVVASSAVAPAPSAAIAAARSAPPPSNGSWTHDKELLTLLRQALDSHATDLHLTDGQPSVMRRASSLITIGRPFEGVASLLNDEQLNAVHGGHAVDLGLTFESRARLRVNVFRAESGLCAAIRFLQLDAPELSTLALPSELLSALGDVPHGLILICGYTGSGKSTTLAALLADRVAQRSRHLITLESPIEYLIPGGSRSLVRQREVGAHVSTFAAGLRDALREDRTNS
jgi:twitching motility protein PilT